MKDRELTVIDEAKAMADCRQAAAELGTQHQWMILLWVPDSMVLNVGGTVGITEKHIY